ncbi:(E)-4-hydroxy-3-methylbut-2-enyl-diphosphate synthase [Leptospira sp. 2 VSF19]|uniref:4-hydroxy-3-methylbut-2-en-1-yl diphosphate synthase (flavodoxin) n=1 Tax=Leptospira soteropolitanensis TaxID=2950025 RepID=A0AAW5VE95_9LEPT|nr:(E)-4-hydroxy-3-methylbut-2-enyl-diphosphate synthase [Leptospira soteropolitanensis]MCW7492974.1 (E)-4-hydroxy-3-methylbut-2-enyl-diphosphate synthase [Leptospira soteropolitanensis]MCW7500209.1 (E)-4-hydroxy-3-methylbut-2-enyl-diphosphate synthase [Leptospira soteropolitanensis]MCW7522460.1 (E)-4-hydroxy-3-methylbut-2-enyl-diphosphate synthase [Leptospira soteropolitanensis]MCW7526316.1 (E)-4-hydroxy-3-methylbut-2-enyl-diphosphate synthase [Leptospira soteropolitanensis]MCW7529572.1 (E)-4
MSTKYNESPFFYKRRPTREVMVGTVGIGGKNPIRIQSMITSNTRDTDASIKQIADLEKAGSEIVRLTVPSQADADNLPNIRKRMKELGLTVPLVADIHFTPQVALKCVEWVEKVRINPGNFADKKKFEIIEYTDKDYNEELERIEEVFTPLVLRAKELGVAMRIGTNHGSLSDRIMNRFGDTPLGMVESALEFIRIAEKNSYKDIVVSMKASNPQVMIQAYRMLVSRFYDLGMDYPLHLGVTEAGDGKDGRIKSAIGIGSLLEDGLGDTIRVSLTEDAIHEIPVAKELVRKYNDLFLKDQIKSPSLHTLSEPGISENRETIFTEFRDPFQYSRFYSKELCLGETKLGDSSPVRIEIRFPFFGSESAEEVLHLIQRETKSGRIPEMLHFAIDSELDLISLGTMVRRGSFPLPVSVELSKDLTYQYDSLAEDLYRIQKWVVNPHIFFKESEESWDDLLDFVTRFAKDKRCVEWSIEADEIHLTEKIVRESKKRKIENLIFSVKNGDLLSVRKLAYHLRESDYPITLVTQTQDKETLLYESSIQVGGSLLDGIGDVVRLSFGDGEPEESLHLSFDILQATRLRLTKTEYISCPSCGRTMFDLQSTTAMIKKRTGHLKGVKIAVMGCIVNGPGEMADADFGYVGAGIGKVHLYKGKEIVKKGVSEEEAADQLIELIRENGMWSDPE